MGCGVKAISTTDDVAIAKVEAADLA